MTRKEPGSKKRNLWCLESTRWMESRVSDRKAVNYAQNRRETSLTFLEDGHCSLSNNDTERSIRRAQSEERTGCSATQSVEPKPVLPFIDSIVETAHANDLTFTNILFSS
ncbi:MAG: transposase [bacterium LCO1.1]|uniref:Transposase n=1 Tax=Candidatus Weimeria bifida TaxID=2599074 RepID=A0A6N7IXF1_9FIRM|nr:transposase [Candidatus Weimeria bifida]